MLLILAHYDDETMISSTLLKLSRKGIKTHIIYLTEGEGGKNRLALPDVKQTEVERQNELIALRSKEIAQSAKVLGFTFDQIKAKDVPLRIPEAGYPNPLGRPTTNVQQFLAAKIWDIPAIKKSIKEIVREKKLRPQIIITLGNDKGVIHAHHQACYQMTKELLKENAFGANVLGVYAILEMQHYPFNQFPLKQRILMVDHTEHVGGLSSETFMQKSYPSYLAHQTQLTSLKQLSTLERISEVLYPMESGNSYYSFAPLEELLGSYYKVRSFSSLEDWKTFTTDDRNWMLPF
jgi:LmbE family N-acetylglucosaminyl deacetylase